VTRCDRDRVIARDPAGPAVPRLRLRARAFGCCNVCSQIMMHTGGDQPGSDLLLELVTASESAHSAVP
jgi:hypothetical protein